MISELSPGDKLSLKGKIFELRKKLNIIEIEKQRQEEYSFRPQISKYDLPERNDFHASVERAEIMRKQKLDMLKATIEQEERCSFKPTIYAKRKTKDDSRPVHERLTEKGQQYQKSLTQRKEQTQKFDENGRRLFQPVIHASPLVSNANDNIGADEFLYRDARNREERMRQLSREAKNELDNSMNARKMNSKSEQLLKRKAEREIRAVFDALDQEQSGEISYDDVQRCMELISDRGGISPDQIFKATECIWTVLDTNKTGRVGFGIFLQTCLPFAAKTTVPVGAKPAAANEAVMPTTAASRVPTAPSGSNRPLQSVTLRADGQLVFGSIPAALSTPATASSSSSEMKGLAMPPDCVAAIKTLISQMVIIIQASSQATTGAWRQPAAVPGGRLKPGGGEAAAGGGAHVFRPHINDRSRELALQKEQKEKAMIALMRSSIASERDENDGDGNTEGDGGNEQPQKAFSAYSSSARAVEAAGDGGGGNSGGSELGDDEDDDEDFDDDMTGSTVEIDLRGLYLADGDYLHEPLPPPPPQPHSASVGGAGNAQAASGSKSTGTAAVGTVGGGSGVGGGGSVDRDRVVGAVEISTYDLLHARAALAEQRKEALRESKRREELSECTFRPRIIERHKSAALSSKRQQQNGEDFPGHTSSYMSEGDLAGGSAVLRDGRASVGGGRGGIGGGPREATVDDFDDGDSEFSQDAQKVPVFERLYSLKDKPVPEKHQPTVITELQACTFKPNVDHRRPAVRREVEAPAAGTDKTVERMRLARETRLREKQRFDDMGAFNEERYNRSRELAARGTAPFSFLSEERLRVKKDKKQGSRPEPKLYIDVKLGPNRTANIPVNEGDDPAKLAHQFCLVYSLDSAAYGVLTEVVRQNMQANGITMAEPSVLGMDDNGDMQAWGARPSISTPPGVRRARSSSSSPPPPPPPLQSASYTTGGRSRSPVSGGSDRPGMNSNSHSTPPRRPVTESQDSLENLGSEPEYDVELV